MGNACCEDNRSEKPYQQQFKNENGELAGTQKINDEDLLRKYSVIRTEVSSCPLGSNRVEQHIKRLSKFPSTPNKMWKLKSPFNLIYVNKNPQYENQLPKDYVKVYKIKQTGQFGGYYEGKINEKYEPDLNEGFYVYHNASYFIGTGHFQGIYTNQATNIKYEGGWLNEQPHGKGLEHNNKGYYQGEYFEGQKEGVGKFVWSDGPVYEGGFLKGAFHGKGKYKNQSLNYFYQGEYCQDLKHGQGLQQKGNESYVGGFNKGKRCGQGKLTRYVDESRKKIQFVYQGTFYNNRPHGQGSFSEAQSGKKINGIWNQGTLIAIH